MKFRHFALTLSVVASAACADNATTPVDPTELRLSANSSSNGAAQSINGNAHINAPEGYRRMVIHARKEADGTVSGKFIIRQEWNGGLELEADISCFTIVDNRAYVGAVLTAVDGVPYNGHLALRVVMVDNGEGSNSAPDQSSQVAASDAPFQPQAFCTNANLVLPMHDLVRGNLQVRP